MLPFAPKAWIFSLVGLAWAFSDAHAAVPERPRLIVLISVDQMRADYVDWYGSRWKHGLRRLFDQGAYFRNARYPYLDTQTCPGHATLGTGAYPRTHGMVLNTWFDRQRQQAIECTEDPASPLIAYGPAPRPEGHSAKNLMAPTLGDEMQAQLRPRPRVVGLSMKARAAVHLSGHTPDLVLWREGRAWVTARAFATERLPWVQHFIDRTPIAALLAIPWTRLLPDTAYKHRDDGLAESPSRGWASTFPHPLAGNGPAPMGKFTESPAADAYLAQLAGASIRALKLGQGPGTDLLGVSFSTTDLVGHDFGPRSHEVQDVLLRLDVVLGQLLTTLDQTVGRDNYVVALSADHGVALIPEQARAEGKDAGRISASELRQRTAAAIAAELGGQGAQESFAGAVVDFHGNDLALAPGLHDRLKAKPGAIARVLKAIATVAGVADVIDSDEIRDPARTTDPVRRAAALSFFPGRSGDILIVPKPHWISGSVGTNHGSLQDYDQRVPVVFFGGGVATGRHERPISPADVVPTLAGWLGVTMSKAEGRALAEVQWTIPLRSSKTRARPAGSSGDSAGGR